MISDVLSDAIHEIKQYLKDQAEYGDYHSYSRETMTYIEATLASMEATRKLLDGVPLNNMKGE